jgi:hypothetical protein
MVVSVEQPRQTQSKIESQRMFIQCVFMSASSYSRKQCKFAMAMPLTMEPMMPT